ncbi:cupin domain-containing protein [Pseudorhodobacter ferrugineus]|uniref:cupin domain-containing protein n=1 Tax=Pseudorhodobacter ferrugineus TaxID=77008 RepID=UPI00041B1F87|nr:cupin domain-containing protein [Pseudorhodobacter ferrugineus]
MSAAAILTIDTLEAPYIDLLPQADNDPFAPTGIAFTVDAATTPLEGGTDPAYGTVRWRTLISGDAQTKREFVLGIAEFEPHGTLPLHRHDPAEFYLGFEGDGIVTIDGVAHRIAAGIAVYVPANAEHGVLAGSCGLRMTYGFAEGAFSDVEYRFSATPG